MSGVDVLAVMLTTEKYVDEALTKMRKHHDKNIRKGATDGTPPRDDFYSLLSSLAAERAEDVRAWSRAARAEVAELIEAHAELLAEVERLRVAMFTTYCVAANGGDKRALIAAIEKERDAYEAGFSGDRSHAALANIGASA